VRGDRPAIATATTSSPGRHRQNSARPASDATDEAAGHRNAPVPHHSCLYGLVGEVGCVGGEGTETNPYAIAANFMAYLSCAIGRGVYLPIGNTWHHARLFCLHVGRSGRGRKGDALSLVMRLDQAVREIHPMLAPQVHRGGLSSREGLVALMHDGYKQGKQDFAPIDDKRLWVVESEFSNVLHQGRREGNTLSAALRDCWDGVSLKPATKSNRLYASNPHVCVSGAISPGELTGLMTARELTNGFANRFLVIWAERTQILPFLKPTPQATVDTLAHRIAQVLEFVGAEQHTSHDRVRMDLTVQAQWRYAQLYRTEINDDAGSDAVNAMLERRAPMLLRVAMLFALTDLQLSIDITHIESAMAWIRFATASVRYVFVSAAEETRMTRTIERSNRVLAFLRDRGQATRSEISAECFRGKESKAQIDASLDQLLAATPPRICVQTVQRAVDAPGSPTRMYRLT
jgi:hypothetical protein